MTEDLRTLLRKAGWRQGSMLGEGPAPIPEHDQIDVLVTHDCDLLHGSLDAEPNVELVEAKVMSSAAVDGNLQFAKNPRTLDILEPHDGRQYLLRLEIRSRKTIPRESLMSLAPLGVLTPENRSYLRAWLSARYSRSALPDVFNERRQPVASRVRKLLKRDGGHLFGLYVTMTGEELAPQQSYEVVLTGVVTVEVGASATDMARAIELVDAVAAELDSCQGIEVIDAAVRTTEEVTMEDQLQMLRVDEFDDLTIREDRLVDS